MKLFKNILIVMVSLFCLLVVLNTIGFAEEPIHPDYPFVFDITGRLDRISDEEMVVDDVLFKLSSSTRYHAPDSIFTKQTAFQKKDRVGLILKNKNTRQIDSVWLIKKAGK